MVIPRSAAPALCARALLAGALIACVPAPAQGRHDTIEEVLVTGQRQKLADLHADAAHTPGGITVVDMDEAGRRNVSSLADMLRYVPGIWSASSTGNDDAFYSSRGSNLDATDYDGNGIKLLQDGLPVTTADGNNHNRVIDPLSAQAAVVARGANGMAFGASTLGGAIDFVSPTARDRPGRELQLTGGSHGLGTLRATAAREFANDSDGLVTIEGKTWDGYREHNQQRRAGLYGNVGWRRGESLETRFYGTYLDNDQELPGSLTRAQFEADPDAATDDAVSGNYQLDVRTWRLANRTTWRPDGRRALSFGVSLEQQELYHPIVDRVMVDPDGPGPLPPEEVFSLLIDTDHTEVGAMLRYDHHFDRHDLRLGLNFATNSVRGSHFRNLGGHRNGRTNRIDNDAESWELFAEDQWHLSERLTLVSSLQAVLASRDTRNVDLESGAVTAPSDDYRAVNPRIGVLYRIGGTTLYGNVSRLYEPPTHYELQDDVRGSDEALNAMTGTVLELGMRGTRESARARWTWETTAYYTRIDDEILSVEDPAAPGTNLASNVDDTVHAGLEALVRGELNLDGRDRHRMELTLSATLNHFEFDGDPVYGDNDLPAAPEYVLRGELLYRNGRGWYLGPTFDVVGERWADFANTYRVGGYEIFGLRGGWESASWRVFVEVQNLLDDDYVATHGVRAEAPAGAALLDRGLPRSVFAGITRTLR